MVEQQATIECVDAEFGSRELYSRRGFLVGNEHEIFDNKASDKKAKMVSFDWERFEVTKHEQL